MPFSKYRIKDSNVNKILGNFNPNKLLSNFDYESLLIDTSSCLHYGSRNMKKSRVVLMATFNHPIRSDFKLQKVNIKKNHIDSMIDKNKKALFN